jgi:hypothetical protein
MSDVALDQQDTEYAERMHHAAQDGPRTIVLRREHLRIGRRDSVSETRLHVAAVGEGDSEACVVEWPHGAVVAAARYRDPVTGAAPSPAFTELTARARRAPVIPPV